MSDEQNEIDDVWGEAMAEQEKTESQVGVDTASDDSGEAKRVELDDFSDNNENPLSGEERRKLDAILDIPVTISMEVGRTQISIRNLLQLNQGSVVELDRLAGEPLDVMVNGTLIAHGEVVVVNDKFGIRLTDVISQTERIKKLK